MQGDPIDAEGLDILPIDADEPRPPRGDGSDAQPSRAKPILLALAVAVVALVVLNIATGEGSDDLNGDEEAAADEGLTGIDADNTFNGDPFDAEAFVAAPDQAFAELRDGQTVRYTLDSLPFSADTVTVVCLRDPATVSDSLLDECDSGTAQHRTTSPGGVIETDITVYRQIAVAGFRRLDCADRGCELRTYADQATGVVVGRAELSWADEPAQRLGPQITVEFDTALVDGSPFTVVGTGFPADTSIHIRPCVLAVGADPFECDWILKDERILTDNDGTFRHDDVADWEIGFGADAITCTDLTAGLCAMTVGLPGADRQPAAVPLEIGFNRFLRASPDLPVEIAVEPSTGLVDGAIVNVQADGEPYNGEFGLFLCAAGGAPIDCTWLDLGNTTADGVYEIPRSFVTWRATRHDCLVDAPCSLNIFAPSFGDDIRSVPISFDPDGELRPGGAVELSPADDLQDWSLLTLTFEELISVPLVTLCATGSAQTCEGVGVEAVSGTELVTRARTTLTTPTGRHNCLFDGPCEVVIWDAATLTRFDPAPLNFAPVEQRPLAGVVRPSTGVQHGTTVQVGVANAIDDVSVSVCRTDGGCVPILVTDTADGRATVEFTAIRIFDAATVNGGLERVDCAVDACDVRISDGWSTEAIPISFGASEVPEAVIAVDIDQPLPMDERFRVLGRDFTPTVQPSQITLSLCPTGSELESSCVGLGTVSTQQLPADGRFEELINIPASAFTTGFQNRMDRCGRECDLVARPLYGVPVRLAVLRDVNAP